MVEKQTVTLALKDKTFLFCGAGIAWVQWRRSAKKRPIFRYGEKSQSLISRKRVASDVVTMPAGSASSIVLANFESFPNFSSTHCLYFHILSNNFGLKALLLLLDFIEKARRRGLFNADIAIDT
ncbi:hypothetical protein HZH66_010771 [Vespula vulgaris]|uniref:Uncharacterized protein n=1 Tax=Vespula vulgaris TaxID=7454 RepID=A0A834JJ47_VESVU|nr:hypothetical protein HZH66_010771 [Vespula vulgaris]